MSLITFTAIFMAGGFLVPLVFRLLWYWAEHSTTISTSFQYYLQNAMLMLWPTSIMNMGGAGNDLLSGRLFFISVISNVIVYGLLGLIMWYGLKHRWILFPLSGGVILLWWRLLTL